MAQINYHVQGILDIVQALSTENSVLTQKLQQAEATVQELKSANQQLEIIPLVSSLPVVARIQVPDNVSTLNIMDLMSLQSSIKVAHAEIDRNHVHNTQAIEHNKKVINTISKVFSDAGLATSSQERYVRPNKGPGRFEQVPTSPLLADLESKLISGDDTELARAQLKILELKLVSGAKRSTSKLSEELVKIANEFGVSTFDIENDRELASQLLPVLSRSNPAYTLCKALTDYNNHNTTRAKHALLEALNDYSVWAVEEYGSIPGTTRVRFMGLRDMANSGLPLSYGPRELGLAPNVVARFNTVYKYLA